MRKFLVRLLINAIALYAAVALLRGSYIYPNTENWIDFIWLALIFGIVNAIIRPALMVMSCPLIILTLGLGTLVVNTAMFALAGWIGTQFGVGFQVNGFWGAFLGALVVSVVSFFLSLIIREEPR
ncbi:MAG TPA: phage holin family protein [Bellilinea sp.]|jgi:putative membrane protein|nr:phage holin family protein [Bellilinea sp.]